jgi:hypothetical protein
MTQTSQGESPAVSQSTGRGTLFGIPLGNLGWFTSLLIGLGVGFMAFFLATFAGIFSILIYNSTTHHTVDYALSYKRGGLPVGIVALVFAWGYLGIQWCRRIFRRN